MWTPCDDPIEEYDEETGKIKIVHKCPYVEDDTDYGSDMCRNYCGLGVDE